MNFLHTLKISIKILINDKKFFGAAICLLSFIVSFLVIFPTISGEILSKSKLEAYQKYGEHDFVISSNSQKQIQSIIKDDTFKVCGQVYISDSYPIGGNQIQATLGAMDSLAFQTGHLALKYGKMPTENNEVVIEAFMAEPLIQEYKDLHADFKLFQPFDITLEDTTYHVVGVIENYSSSWTNPDFIEIGYNTFPNIILNSEVQDSDYTLSNNTFLLMKKQFSLKDNMSDYIREHELEREQILMNHRLEANGLSLIKRLQDYTYLFIALSYFVSFLTIFYLFFTQYIVRKIKVYEIFYATGLTPTHIHILIISQGTILFVLSVIAGTFISTLVLSIYQQWFLQNQTDTIKIFNIPILIGITIFFGIVLAIITVIMKRRLFRQNSNVSGRTLVPILHNKISKFSLQWKIILMQIVGSIKLTILNIGSLALTFVLLFLNLIITNETAYEPDQNTAHYGLLSKQTIAEEILNQYPVTLNQKFSFSFEDTEELEKLDSVRFISKIPLTLGTTLLLTDEQLSPYFRQWMESYTEENSFVNFSTYDYDSLNIPENYHPIKNVNFLLVDQQNWEGYNQILQLAPSVYEQLEKSASTILFVPEKTDKQKLENLTIGRIEVEKSELTFKRWDLNVIDIIPSEFIDPNTKSSLNGPTILLHENVVAKEQIFPGIADIEVYRKSNLSHADIQDLEDKLLQLIARFPGSLYYSKDAEFEETENTVNYLRSLSMTLMIFVIIFSAIIFYLIFFMKILVKEREWLIYRALGEIVNKTVIRFVLEILCYYILSAIGSIIILAIILFLFPVNPTALLKGTTYLLMVTTISFVSSLPIFILLRKKISLQYISEILSKN
ncbi:hypothetical protein MUB24_03820 [Lederbergia sp. NSJ-179]|uniref:FtsX-like permease family protein n=1 Tax=Lederbergia sp. NSJ-179 TaxID=2931402 RepID=UPI001FD61EE7|nr:hypothetical protein [Lederbergia sp. NSJ-179]MCJ7840052.1 hypothetical protein [Lederbergia sp. NSJ-179]